MLLLMYFDLWEVALFWIIFQVSEIEEEGAGVDGEFWVTWIELYRALLRHCSLFL